MQRKILNFLTQWKVAKSRKPLLIKGARQVGKTYLVEEFGKQFENYHEFNFQRSPKLREIFESTSEPLKLISLLEILSEKKIDIKTDLIFFDEIQDCPKALNSLKFFCEDLPTATVVGAGSLLGVYLSGYSFPVGKVEFLEMYPMSFEEYLLAMGKDRLVDALVRAPVSSEVPSIVHELMLEELRTYYIVGGMPEAVRTYVETKDLSKVRQKQVDLLTSYRADFAKYSGPANALHILSVFENIPRQLAKENKKFQFNQIKSGGRYAAFKSAIDWLSSAGLAHKVPIINSAEIPLKMNAEENTFKLYFMDVGLLGALAEIPINSFQPGEDFFKTFKGAHVENFVLQELKANSSKALYCWQGRASEVDFLVEKEGRLYPLEVKSGKSGKLKSLSVFSEKYKVSIKTRVSAMPLERREGFQIIPLYLSGVLLDFDA
jgi:uncharacterized protein